MQNPKELIRLEVTPMGDVVDKWLRGELVEPGHWLGDTLDKHAVSIASEDTKFIHNSVAWILYIRMVDKQRTEGLEMDPESLSRLGTLISVFRTIARPKMTISEQEAIGIFFSKNENEILDHLQLKDAVREVRDDLEYITNSYNMPLILQP